MAEKKITKRESFTEIVEILKGLGKERLVGVMEHELELLAKKNASGTGKLTAVQVANEGISPKSLSVWRKSRTDCSQFPKCKKYSLVVPNCLTKEYQPLCVSW